MLQFPLSFKTSLCPFAFSPPFTPTSPSCGPPPLLVPPSAAGPPLLHLHLSFAMGAPVVLCLTPALPLPLLCLRCPPLPSRPCPVPLRAPPSSAPPLPFSCLPLPGPSPAPAPVPFLLGPCVSAPSSSSGSPARELVNGLGATEGDPNTVLYHCTVLYCAVFLY